MTHLGPIDTVIIIDPQDSKTLVLNLASKVNVFCWWEKCYQHSCWFHLWGIHYNKRMELSHAHTRTDLMANRKCKHSSVFVIRDGLWRNCQSSYRSVVLQFPTTAVQQAARHLELGLTESMQNFEVQAPWYLGVLGKHCFSCLLNNLHNAKSTLTPLPPSSGTWKPLLRALPAFSHTLCECDSPTFSELHCKCQIVVLYTITGREVLELQCPLVIYYSTAYEWYWLWNSRP